MMECRAGLRRFPGVHVGDEYQAIIAHGGEGDYSTPNVHERTIGDLVDPRTPGRVMEVVNDASLAMGADVAGWRVGRLLSLVAGLESREQPDS